MKWFVFSCKLKIEPSSKVVRILNFGRASYKAYVKIPAFNQHPSIAVLQRSHLFLQQWSPSVYRSWSWCSVHASIMHPQSAQLFPRQYFRVHQVW